LIFYLINFSYLVFTLFYFGIIILLESEVNILNTKSDFRSFFASVKRYLKFQPFLKELGINQSAFSKFMKNDLFDYEVSIEKLNLLYIAICDFCDSIKVA
jgi:hypothetical protein